MYIFFSLAIGMAVGVSQYGLALFGSFFIGIITYILSKSKFSTPVKSDLLLQFTFNSNGTDSSEYSKLIDKFCRKSKLLNARAIGMEYTLELSYYIGFKNKQQSTEFIQKLRKIEGVSNVNLFYDEEYF